MDIKTLETANDLNEEIKYFNEALNCFEWETIDGSKISTNPRLIIEFDGSDDREQLKLPLVLSETMIEFIKKEIIKGRDAALAEFNDL